MQVSDRSVSANRTVSPESVRDCVAGRYNERMHETVEELEQLEELLVRSARGSGSFLKSSFDLANKSRDDG